MTTGTADTKGGRPPYPPRDPLPTDAQTTAEARIADVSPPDVPILDAPADGVPPVVDTPKALADASARLTGGAGPLALDTERAQGFRYTAKAYLIQFRREGAGTVLLDPVAFEGSGPRADLHALADGPGE